MVTFETKVYENDWEYILRGNYLDKMISYCNYNFSKKRLFINNVNNVDRVKKQADKKVSKGIIDEYYVVDEYAIEALSYFGIQKESFHGGYYYSIAELVSIYLCESEFLMHLSGDSFIPKRSGEWIHSASIILRSKIDIIVANPTWNFSFSEAQKESIGELNDFYLGYGFSDQCYLIKVDIFKNMIYNEVNVASSRYPIYGGELFEKRVDSFMRNHSLYRITSKDVSYIHENFNFKTAYRIQNRLFLGRLVNKRFKQNI